MDGAPMPRDAQGKFAPKNDEHRLVRSIRLTDTTWSVLGVIADSLSLTKADLLEQIFSDYPHPSNTRQDEEIVANNLSQMGVFQPSNTRQDEEIRWLTQEVAHLRYENAKLVEGLMPPTQVNDLEAIRERVLSNLKLGKQAPGYKTAKSALNQFIQLLRAKL